MNTLRQIRLDAGREATRLRRELGLADDESADPFQAVHELGLWLVFNELDDLLGAMSREGAGGIMINPLRPLGMQRYTVAHELGHWRMHQDARMTWDRDAEIMTSPARIEREAQAFAASFLMPRRLLNSSLRKAGVGANDQLRPEQAYLMSRDVGVSYTALVHELANIQKITARNRNLLLKTRVRDIKVSLGGTGTSDSGSHVWPVDRTADTTVYPLVEGDELAVFVAESPATGYRWSFNTDSGPLELIRDEVEPTPDGMIGGTLGRRVVFRARTDGKASVTAGKVRSFEHASAPIDQFAIRASVSLTPERQNALLLTAPAASDS